MWISIGYRERRRRVMGDGSGSSKDCGHLVEFVPCEDPVCFQWRVEEEGACMPNEGTCGSGSRSQTVACVNSEGSVKLALVWKRNACFWRPDRCSPHSVFNDHFLLTSYLDPAQGSPTFFIFFDWMQVLRIISGLERSVTADIYFEGCSDAIWQTPDWEHDQNASQWVYRPC